MKLIKTLLLPVLFVAMWSLTGCNEEPMTSVTPDNTPSLSKLTLPAGASVTNATFYIRVGDPTSEDITVHKVNVPWVEATETWNSFDAKGPGQYGASLGSLLPDVSTVGYKTADITALVQSWLADPTSNYGVLLNQAIESADLILTGFYSREWAPDNWTPYLEVTYTPAGGGAPVTVREDAFADTYVNSNSPDQNFGNATVLYTARTTDPDYIKYVLVKFDIEQTPEETCETAYAFGDTPFCGLPNIGNWGWTELINGNYTNTDIPIYAGAAQCDPTKGTRVGTLSITYVGTSLTVNYTMNSGVTVDNVHMWIGSTPLPVRNGKLTSAPGQFNYNNVTFPFNLTRSNPFYIAVHFDVCWVE